MIAECPLSNAESGIGFSDWTCRYGGDYFHLQHPTWFKGDPDVKRTTVDFIVAPFRSVSSLLDILFYQF